MKKGEIYRRVLTREEAEEVLKRVRIADMVVRDHIREWLIENGFEPVNPPSPESGQKPTYYMRKE